MDSEIVQMNRLEISNYEKIKKIGEYALAYSFYSVATLVLLIWFPIHLNCNAVHDMTVTYGIDTHLYFSICCRHW